MRSLLLSLLCVAVFAAVEPVAVTAQTNVLVFSKTEGFRHASIGAGIQMIRSLGTEQDFGVTTTEDAGIFSEEGLSPFDAVVFLNTTGDVLNAQQQQAFEAYVRAGGGYVGIHSAADTEYDWPFYGQLVGAWFRSHPAIQPAEVRVADLAHPSTRMLPRRWDRTDEWYSYRTNPRGDVHVLATLGNDTFSGGEMGFDHPIAWCQPFEGGRSWYTGGGHTDASYSEPLFREHVLGGIRYAAGLEPGDCSATVESNWEKTILDGNPSDPMELVIANDGRVFYVERGGALKIIDAAGNSTTTAGRLDVHNGHEDGLLGIALDPDFDENQWIYLFYSPAGGAPRQYISRFEMDGNTLDGSSEQILLEIATQRVQCCHSGGSLAFGPDGNLYASTGDNTNPFESDGYAPIDERTGRSAWDAQKSAANMNDLRGKILRIRPEDDGTYSIPDGNLFPADGSAGRPEIYVMGNRNPFRINVDQESGWLYWGEVGPDANGFSASRGPAGHDEWNQARAAGNYGWPYCIADNKAYRDFNFASSASGAPFDCAAPVNDSPNNTGGSQLPPAQSAWIWYPYGNSVEFPDLNQGGGRTAMGGPVYHFDPDLRSSRKLPAYYDDTVFIYEWSRNWLREVKVDEEGNVLEINPFGEGMTFRRPMDLEIGPDGALYLIEWGSGFSGGNSDAQIVRLEYDESEVITGGPEAPTETEGLRVYRAFPNPTSSEAQVVYELGQNMRVTVDLYDAAGRRVAQLIDASQTAGLQQVEIDTRMLASGVYFYRITTPLSSQTGELVIVR